jgi:plasmid stability protein
MEQTLTISQLDPITSEWLRQEAARTGTSVEAVARRLIYRGVESERQKIQQQRYHDLDSLFGTWSDEEADEFLQAVEDFNQIDPALWQ